MHSHARGCQGVSALKEGLLPLTQEAMMFYEDVAYHDYEGIAEDMSESDRMAKSLGPMSQMILRNHGAVTVGKTVGETFWRMYHLEMACGAQMDILATTREVVLPSPETCRKVRQQYEKDFYPGYYEWPALSAIHEPLSASVVGAARGTARDINTPQREARQKNLLA